MQPQNILDLTRDALSLVLWVCFPIVGIATAVSLVTAVLQAVTQIQDQSIGQSLRIMAVLLTLLVLAGWLGRDVLRFAQQAFTVLAMLR